MSDLDEPYPYVAESTEYQSVALDSVSEIAEVCPNAEKRACSDPRQAYGATHDKITAMVRMFRDLPGMNVYMSAKLDQVQDEIGHLLYGPSMPGKQTSKGLPYLFDEVFALRTQENAEGETVSTLQCHKGGGWEAKDRSGKLEQWERPDLGAIIEKVSAS